MKPLRPQQADQVSVFIADAAINALKAELPELTRGQLESFDFEIRRLVRMKLKSLHFMEPSNFSSVSEKPWGGTIGDLWNPMAGEADNHNE